MKNSFGSSVIVTLFGESHGPFIGVTIDGLAPGIDINEAYIKSKLNQRRPYDSIGTKRKETDCFRIISGVYNHKTTGTPISVIIPNSDVQNKAYNDLRFCPRPGHADYTASQKYKGFEDARGGGHFSGRVTVGVTVAGAIAMYALERKNIYIGTHIRSLGGISDDDFSDMKEQIKLLNGKSFCTINDASAEQMQRKIILVSQAGDSLGGTTETAIVGLPAGVGEPWFDTVEGILSHALFSIPGIKGIEFGDAFTMVNKLGSEYNDAFAVDNNCVYTKTNHNAGINGGITNGMPVIFKCAVKPTPSITKPQETVNLKTMQNTVIGIEGRHDPAFINRIPVVINSVCALALCDLLAQKYGTNWLGGV